MPHLSNTPALAYQLMKLSNDEKCKNICVLHMTGQRQNVDD